MKKFNSIKTKYLQLGVTESNIGYVIDIFVNGTKREYIIETLTSGYRGMHESQSMKY